MNKNTNKVIKFIEKPKEKKAKKIIEKKGCWNSGIVLARKDSIINNAQKIQKDLFNYCLGSTEKSKLKNQVPGLLVGGLVGWLLSTLLNSLLNIGG